MKKRTTRSIMYAAAGALCLQGMGALDAVPAAMTVMADELLEEDEDPEMSGDPESSGEQVPETEAPEPDEFSEDVPLVEDSGEESISVSEGDSLDEVLEDEAREQALLEAQEKLEALLQEQLWMPELPSAEKLTEYLDELTQMESPTGSDGEILMSRYLRGILEGYGYTVSEQDFHEGFLNDDLVDVPGINLIAERGADSEERTKKILVLCTHYDSKTSPAEGDPLANDKSGTAALLETARLLASAESDVDLCFLFLSGEEDGSYGAQAFVNSLSEDLKNRICGVIVADQIGYTYDSVQTEEDPDHPLYAAVTKDGTENEPAKLLLAAAGSNTIVSDGIRELVEDPFSGDAFAETEEAPETELQDTASGDMAGVITDTDQTGDFSLGTLEGGAGAVFETLGLPVVTVMQDLEGRVTFTESSELAETENTSEAENPENAGTADTGENTGSTDAAENDGQETEIEYVPFGAENTETAGTDTTEITGTDAEGAAGAGTEETAGTDGENTQVSKASLQIEDLRWATNIIAQTAAMYMQSVQVDEIDG